MAWISDYGGSSDGDPVAYHNRGKLSVTDVVKSTVLGAGPADRVFPLYGGAGLAAWDACAGSIQSAGVGRFSHAAADGNIFPIIYPA